MEWYYRTMTKEENNLQAWTQAQLNQWSIAANSKPDQQDLRSVYNIQNTVIAQFNGTAQQNVCGYVTYYGVSYPIILSQIGPYDTAKPSVLIRGGTHGYEPEGVFANLEFQREAGQYIGKYNVLAIACTNPWAFVKDERWGAHGIDGNRSWFPGSENQEADAIFHFMEHKYPEIRHHGLYIDLSNHTWPVERDIEHDALKAEREGQPFTRPNITTEAESKFFVIHDEQRHSIEIGNAMVKAVKNVIPILEPDEHGQIYGCDLQHEGGIFTNLPDIDVVMYQKTRIALTTEIKVGDDSIEKRIQAQVTATHAALQAA